MRRPSGAENFDECMGAWTADAWPHNLLVVAAIETVTPVW
ncbi:hypothetical protein MMAR_0723 [Mycobacterium marinum M]|uniref:Uncharacterized protein n=1 Tax=Mycobacterium marinum (strain ATCC BAA-535 / M) TaxID=216594 RepID=B2HQ05_MYCMM|nr:hypothetical protein MMAR_0723 [Mycobacterium marinum M]